MKDEKTRSVQIAAPVGEIEDRVLEAFYPELASSRGLDVPLQAALFAVGSDLEIPQRAPKTENAFFARSPYWCRVQRGKRFSQIKIALQQRLFMSDFWDSGVCLASASTVSLEEMAHVLHAWNSEGMAPSTLQNQFPFVKVNEIATVFEQGVEFYVAHQWQSLIRHLSAPRTEKFFNKLTPLVEFASIHPVLKTLYPYTSLNRLCFSRCTGYPFSYDCPSAYSFEERMFDKDKRSRFNKWRFKNRPVFQINDANNKLIGYGEPQEAVELIVNALPADCGAAIMGTADDLKFGS